MELKELLKQSRSYRLYDHQALISQNLINEWIEATRYAPSARNLQALKFATSILPSTSDPIFHQIKWAGYLADFSPTLSQSATAYIAILIDRNLTQSIPSVDIGICAQTILLSATNSGYGGCIIEAFHHRNINKILNLPKNLEVTHIIALGKPLEESHIESVQNNDIKYYRSSPTKHHVPKRSLSEICIPLNGKD